MGRGSYPDRRARPGDGMSRNKKPGPLGGKATAGKSLTDAEGRLFGMLLRPHAHAFARACRRILEAAGYVDADSYRLAFHQDDGDADDDMAEQLPKTVSVPVMLLAATAELLSMMPGPRRGRPRKASTNEAVRLTRTTKSIREAAKFVAAITGESPEKIRTNLMGLERRSKKGPTGAKQRKKGGRV